MNIKFKFLTLLLLFSISYMLYIASYALSITTSKVTDEEYIANENVGYILEMEDTNITFSSDILLSPDTGYCFDITFDDSNYLKNNDMTLEFYSSRQDKPIQILPLESGGKQCITEEVFEKNFKYSSYIGLVIEEEISDIYYEIKYYTNNIVVIDDLTDYNEEEKPFSEIENEVKYYQYLIKMGTIVSTLEFTNDYSYDHELIKKELNFMQINYEKDLAALEKMQTDGTLDTLKSYISEENLALIDTINQLELSFSKVEIISKLVIDIQSSLENATLDLEYLLIEDGKYTQLELELLREQYPNQYDYFKFLNDIYMQK